MGLGPPVWFLIFVKGYCPHNFHLPFWWGIAMGVVFQLSTAACCKDYINVQGFAWGAGGSNTLLGFNDIGTAVAWGLAGLTLLEDSEGSNLILAAAHGNKHCEGHSGRAAAARPPIRRRVLRQRKKHVQ
ncbi:hypothetical protein WJX77_006190 [Trebouxia sp. C0004]